MFTSDYTDKFLAAIENLGLTKKQLLQADKDKSCEKLNKILNKLDKASLVNLTSQLAVYSYKARIEAAKNLDNTTAMFEKIVKTLNDTHLFLNDDEKKTARRKQAKSGGIAKHKNDPKQAAKADVKVFYVEWQSHGNPKSMYRSAAAFATAMMDKFNDPNNEKPTLESQTVITRWCKQWKKELNNTHPA